MLRHCMARLNQLVLDGLACPEHAARDESDGDRKGKGESVPRLRPERGSEFRVGRLWPAWGQMPDSSRSILMSGPDVVASRAVEVAPAGLTMSAQGVQADRCAVATVRTGRRRQGWGRSAVTVLLARLRELGASGVTVCTPADYTGAIATYRSAGLRPIETLQSLALDRAGQSTA